MARIRTIKPDFWTDEKTGMLSDGAKVLFIGTWNYADDFGVLEYRPVELCARILPFRTTSVEDALTRPMEQELLTEGLVRLFEHSGKQYLWIVNFLKHQRINRPSEPLLKGWTKTTTPDTYRGTPLPLPPNSVSTHSGKEGRERKERIGKEGREGGGPPVRGTPTPSPSSASSTRAAEIPAPATAPAGTPPGKPGAWPPPEDFEERRKAIEELESRKLHRQPDEVYQPPESGIPKVSEIAESLGLPNPLNPLPATRLSKPDVESRREALKAQAEAIEPKPERTAR